MSRSVEPVDISEAPRCQGPGCNREAKRPAAYPHGERSAFCLHCWRALRSYHRGVLVKLYQQANRWDEAERIRREIRKAVEHLEKGAA